MRRYNRFVLGVALSVALLALGVPAQADPADAAGRPFLGFWPLFVRDAQPVAGVEATRIAGPLFESWETTGGEPPAWIAPWESVWTLRPFAAGLTGPEHADGGRVSNLELLHPLAEWRSRPERSSLRLTPFADRSVRFEPEAREPEAREPEAREPEAREPEARELEASELAAEGSGRDRWTVGLAFGGRTGEGERYGGLFPLAGVAKQRFGRERIEFLLFPLFGRSRDRHGFVRTHVLWPFFSFGKGGGRSLWRIWPFYGRDVREGEWDRRFALWPFLHWRTERPGEPTERRVRLVLPFYGEARSEHARSRFVLGPLYMSAENDRTGARSLDIAWPFFRKAETPAREDFAGARELKVEPLFRLRLGPGYERVSHLFGLYDRQRSDREGVRFEALRVLFVNRFEHQEEVASGDSRTRRDLWPLWSQRERTWHDDAGEPHRSGRLYAPWLLPLGGESFQRNAAGLFTLYERRWLDDEVRSDWLYGMARSREAPAYELDALAWLLQRERVGEELPRWRVLGVPIPPR
jgi:hypothetical protein